MFVSRVECFVLFSSSGKISNYVLVVSNYIYFWFQNKRKCFTVDQPRDTPIVFAYEILDDHHVVDFSLYYGETGLAELQIMNISLHKPVGHVDFTADNSGPYAVCVQQKLIPEIIVPTVSTNTLFFICISEINLIIEI